ncbi:MAG: isoleucine--tRNA ligase [Elusimicrobia bacterium RIFOXYD12_FULL_66_9]|nr:MAG: isoleucine--tRNA ligase [Elusimicrobia bacterium RIFOXYD12_FULL_66_9]
MPEARTDWSSTVRLPKTDFPMKGDLAKREPDFLKSWEGAGLYALLQERQKARPPFILHDGPPYANGSIHIGHALNKVLKDITVKSRALMGHAASYVPGWDCHGLPIETALLKEMKMSKRGVTDIPKFRRDAAAFAERFIGLQREEFKRLGILGDWEAPYKTMDRAYEGKILRAFRLLAQKGHVYRGLKPVLWCPTCETALAEAEVEYKDKTSPSVYVALPVTEGELKGAEIVVWTTTPWTLPANRAAAFHPNMEYVEVTAAVSGRPRRLIVAKPRFEAFVKEVSAAEAEVVRAWSGEQIVALLPRYALPYATKPGETGVSVLAEYVTAEDGTGIVHTAPGHGEDDFHTGQRYGLEILNPVDASGRFTDKAPRWAGKSIFKEGNPEIAADLAERGLLLAKKDIVHSYPHCWRCKNPVIFRTTEQWFLRLSEALREHLLKEIDSTRWIPPEGRTRIAAMVSNRPDWCLSRQRVWGTPIPVLYSVKTGQPLLDDAVLQAIERQAATQGIDFWFERWGEVLKPADWPFLPVHPDLAEGFRRESDILDVWLDSGVSWLAVLGEDAVADLYLEGSDQHRGWFQSSLVMSTALRGKAPYKAVLTHGFVLDDKGRAMHKSAGNVVAPQQVIGKWGADVLRLWVALSDYNDDVRISDKLLEGPADSYRRVRNTLRYLLGSLCDFDPAAAVPHEKLPEMERFMLHRLSRLQNETLEDYREYRYRAAARRLVDFCAFDLSAFYLDATKDRLYTFRADAPERLAAQTVMAEVLRRLCSLLSPVLSFTAEEAWLAQAPPPTASVFLWDLPEPELRWTDAALAERWEKVAAVRSVVQKSLEEARAAKVIGASLQARVVLKGSAEALAPLKGLDLPEVLIVSGAALDESGGELSVSVSQAEGAKCPRCWRWQSDIGSTSSHPELCGRCARQLS